MGSIIVEISSDTVNMVYVNVREDLWNDYKYFRDAAIKQSAEKGGFIRKRYERAALVTLFSYMEAVVNVWLQRLLAKQNKGALFGRYQRCSLCEKCRQLLKHSKAKLANPQFKKSKELRNAVVHFGAGRDLAVYENITSELISRTEQTVEGWLNDMSAILGYEKYPDSEKELEKFGNDLGTKIP